MSEVADLPLADTTDMIGMHRVFRYALADAPQLVDSATGDPERCEAVATYYDNVLRLLHVHHDGEDELISPRLAERATVDEAVEVARIAAQHADVRDDISAAEGHLAAWRETRTSDAGAYVADSLGALNASLTPHLDEEEAVVLPIAARYLNVAEWGELPGHGMRSFTGDKLWLIIGLIREQMTPEQVEAMDAHMPPPVAQFWAASGRVMFTDFVTDLRRQ